jgi:Transglycosylase SLT domain
MPLDDTAAPDYSDLYVKYGDQYGVSPYLLRAVAQHESGENAHATSPPNRNGTFDRGLMQINDGTAPGIGVRNPYDPEQAVGGAARLLRQHLDRFHGDTDMALAAYNAGPDPDNWTDTQRQYVQDVKNRMPAQQAQAPAAKPAMTLDTIRQNYPQYKDLSDEQLLQGLHNKFYSDMPFDAFAAKLGYKPQGAGPAIAVPPGAGPTLGEPKLNPLAGQKAPGGSGIMPNLPLAKVDEPAAQAAQPEPTIPFVSGDAAPIQPQPAAETAPQVDTSYGPQQQSAADYAQAMRQRWGDTRAGKIVETTEEAYKNSPDLLTPMAQKWADDHGIGGDARAIGVALKAFQAAWAGLGETANQLGQSIGQPQLGRDAAAMIESAGMTGAPHGQIGAAMRLGAENRAREPYSIFPVTPDTGMQTPPPAQRALTGPAAAAERPGPGGAGGAGAPPPEPGPAPTPAPTSAPQNILERMAAQAQSEMSAAKPPAAGAAIPMPAPQPTATGLPAEQDALHTLTLIAATGKAPPPQPPAPGPQQAPAAPSNEDAPRAGETRTLGAAEPEPEAPAPEAPPVQKPIRKPVDAVTALIDAGGVRDPGGDLKAMGADTVHHRAAGRLVNNRSGMQPDYAREFLVDRGYLPQDADINSVHDLIADHVAGRPTFTAEDQAEAREWEQGRQAYVEQDRHNEALQHAGTVASEAGIRLTPEDAQHAAQMIAGGIPAYEAVYEAARTGDMINAGLASPRSRFVPGQSDLFGRGAQPPAARPQAEPTIRNDQRQAVMPGMEPSAVQAQAARDQAVRGGINPAGAVRPADEGLFAPKPVEQPALPVAPVRTSRWLQHAGFQDRLAEYPTQPHPVSPHMQAAEWVFDMGRKTGHEHLAVVDNHTGEVIHAGTSESPRQVPFDGRTLLDLPPDSLTAHHNHPTSGSLSRADVSMLAVPALSHVVAHGHDGSTYIASLSPTMAARRGHTEGEARRLTARLRDAYNDAAKVADDILRPMVADGRLPVDVANMVYWDVANRALQAGGVIRYASTRQLSAVVEAAFRTYLERRGHDPVSINRYTESVRPEERVASLPARLHGQPTQGPAGGQGGGGGRATLFGEVPSALREEGSPLDRVPLYSAVGRAVDTLKQARGTGAQMLSMIAKTPGVKPEEMKWTGLEDWLRGQGHVTKEAIQDYVRANSLDVREVAKVQNEEGGIPGRGTKYASYQLPGGENYRELLITLPPKEITPVVGNGEPIFGDGRARWQGKQLVEGVIDYPVTVPGGKDGRITYWPQTYDHMGRERGPQWVVNTPDVQNSLANSMEAAVRRISDAYAGTNRGVPTRADVYRSSHWDEPNVLAHVRFSERTAPDGKRVLLVEEVQSDWHQKGRKEGYDLPNMGPEYAVYSQGSRIAEGLTKEQAEARAAELNARGQTTMFKADETGYPLRGAVPDAPFKTTWPQLAMKRMIKYAVDNGFDRVAWTPGDVQAARYDLSKQISNIELKDQGAAHYLTALDLNGRKVLSQVIHDPEKELPDIIGKEASEKLLNQDRKSISLLPRVKQFDLNAESREHDWRVTTPDGRAIEVGKGTVSSEEAAKEYAARVFNDRAESVNKRRQQEGASRELSGLDLKVGGEGMKGFYDKMLPNEVQKIVGKYGAKVGRSEVGVSYEKRDTTRPDEIAQREYHDRWRQLVEYRRDAEREAQEQGTYGASPRIEQIDREMDALHSRMVDETMARGQAQPVHSVDITPAMQTAVDREGLALFEPPEPFTGGGGGGGHEPPGEPPATTPEPPEPIRPEEAARMGRMTALARRILDPIGEMWKSGKEAVSPMQAGTPRAQAWAADFANTLRQVSYRFGELDRYLERTFNPNERLKMATALDAQSVFEQQARDMAPAELARARTEFDAGGTGLAGLTNPQRQAVEMLNVLAERTWQMMKERGMVAPNSVGIPYYFPRQIMMWTEEHGFERPSGRGGEGGNRGLDQRGANLSTSGPMRREHLTPEETEAAGRAKLGANAALLRDIRMLPSRLAQSQRAVAGVDLMNRIEQVGRDTGVNLVVRGGEFSDLLHPADYFTMSDHPAFRRWTGNGFQMIHVSKEFEGPLKAVLTQPPAKWYQGAMAVNNAIMRTIMFSPFIHLQVEMGRAFPMMLMHDPIGAFTFKMMRNGSRVRGDLDYMDTATRDGIVPLGQSGKGGWRADPVSIANEAAGVDGRNAFIRAIAGYRDAVANAAGGIPKIGPWAHDLIQHPHQTLLWDQVFNLQMGLYDALKEKWTPKYGPQVAGTMAAHIANRYAGALPPEHLSRWANMAANLVLFSRSFTLGNLGVIKDMFKGAPSHVLARIEQIAGREGAKGAKWDLQKKALAAFVLDIGLGVMAVGVGSVLYQAVTKGLSNATDQYADEAKAALNGFTSGNPLDILGVLPQYWNEPGKQQRVSIGTDSQGRGNYIRLPVGKIGEEFTGWFTHPGDMLMAKMKPTLRPLVELLIGRDALGRELLPPYPNTIGSYVETAGDAVRHFVSGLGPTATIQGLNEMFHTHVLGEKPKADPFVSAMKVIGPATGLGLISQGYPGGPAAGEIHAQSERDRYELMKEMPAIRDKIRNGDTEAAVADMTRLNVPPQLRRYYIQQTNNPGVTRGAMRKLQAMPPEVKERVQRTAPP